MSNSFTEKMQNFFNGAFTKHTDKFSFLPTARTVLMVSLFLLISLSLLMIASASIPFATNKGMSPLSFFYNQLSYLGLGLVLAWIAYKIPLKFYFKYELIGLAWLVTLILLVLTLIVAPEVNGAKRWIDLGPANFQAAELCKVVMIFLISEYVVRRSVDVRHALLSNRSLLVFYTPMAFLLMMQPDFGSFVIVTLSMVLVFFVAGMPGRPFIAVLISGVLAMVIFVLFSPYRLKRILAFQNPFEDAQNAGFQLAHSLAALARGGLFGAGYSDGIQKLSYLPEAHTDFILAITGEELGLLGSSFVLFLEFCIIASMMRMSYVALQRRQLRICYTLFGFAIIIFGQTFINIGMNIGLTPSKGLTLPFFSYGGSSLLMLLVVIGFVLNADKSSAIINANKQNGEY